MHRKTPGWLWTWKMNNSPQWSRCQLDLEMQGEDAEHKYLPKENRKVINFIIKKGAIIRRIK